MKIKILLASLIFLISINNIFCQSKTWNYWNKAQYCLFEKKSDSAIYFINKLEKHLPLEFQMVVFKLNIEKQKKKKQFINEILKYAATSDISYNDALYFLSYDSVFYFSKIDKENFKEKFYTKKAQFYRKVNIDYLKSLTEINTRDQSIRNLRHNWNKSMDSTIYKFLLKQMIIQDSLNFLDLLTQVDCFGLPNAKNNINPFFLIMMLGHNIPMIGNDTITFQKYFIYFEKKFKDCLKENTISPDTYALFVDFIYNRHFGYQYYGTYILRDENQRKVFLKVIDDFHLDQRRKEIGLMNLSDYCKMRGLDCEDLINRQKYDISNK